MSAGPAPSSGCQGRFSLLGQGEQRSSTAPSRVPRPAVCATLGYPAGLRRLCPAAPPSPLRPPPRSLSSLPSLPRWLRRGSGGALLPCVCFGVPGRRLWAVRGAGLCHGASARLCRGLSAVGTCLWLGNCSMHLSYICVLILGIYRYRNKCLRTFELPGKSPEDGFISLWSKSCISVFLGRALGVSGSNCCLHIELYT